LKLAEIHKAETENLKHNYEKRITELEDKIKQSEVEIQNIKESYEIFNP
jgi:hypothetical protein